LQISLCAILIGLLGSWVLGKELSSLLYGIQAHDTTSLVGSACGLLTVVLVAGQIPAARLAALDPSSTLRRER
jgi:ABC-type antimicrobial peptide transport system permease subunit